MFFFHAIDTMAHGNDTHRDLMIFYECVKNKCPIFSRLLYDWITGWEKSSLEGKSAMYYKVRDRYNKNNNATPSHRAVDFFLLRELAYGGMFRENAKGEFNVPFGRAYAHNKNLRGKVDYLHSGEVRTKMKQLTLHTLDFGVFLDQFDFNHDDFMFVDPPYDTSFSKYGCSDFDTSDQIRLSEHLKKFKGRFLLVCKLTPLTEKLYTQHHNFQVLYYNCRYKFNIKGRFPRESVHIRVTNYVPD